MWVVHEIKSSNLWRNYGGVRGQTMGMVSVWRTGEAHDVQVARLSLAGGGELVACELGQRACAAIGRVHDR